MTEKQIEKELNRQAVLFEEACMKGNVVAAIKFEDFVRQLKMQFLFRKSRKLFL